MKFGRHDTLVTVLFAVLILVAHWQSSGIGHFGVLMFIAFGVLHLVNFHTMGFGLGKNLQMWRAARKFRKSIPESMAEGTR